jgi:hypothetical protein
MVAMKSTIVGLLAIPVIIGLLSIGFNVSACTGSAPGHVYLNKAVTVASGHYAAEPFTIEEVNDEARISNVDSGRLMVLSDAQMANFTAGKSYTTEFNATAPMGNISNWLHLPQGKYWAVLDNRMNNNNVTATLKIERPEVNYKCGTPAFVPGFDALPMVFVLILISIVAAIMVKKKN